MLTDSQSNRQQSQNSLPRGTKRFFVVWETYQITKKKKKAPVWDFRLHKENRHKLGDRLADSLRIETAKHWTDYEDNLICRLLNFTVAQQLGLLGLCVFVGQLHTWLRSLFVAD